MKVRPASCDGESLGGTHCPGRARCRAAQVTRTSGQEFLTWAQNPPPLSALADTVCDMGVSWKRGSKLSTEALKVVLDIKEPLLSIHLTKSWGC